MPFSDEHLGSRRSNPTFDSSGSTQAGDLVRGFGRGAVDKLGMELAALGLVPRQMPYSSAVQRYAADELARRRDAYIAEESPKPWYQQGAEMAQGLVNLPGAFVDAAQNQRAGEFGEAMGSGMVPDAYAYSSKPGEMISANGLNSTIAAAGTFLPGGKIGRYGAMARGVPRSLKSRLSSAVAADRRMAELGEMLRTQPRWATHSPSMPPDVAEQFLHKELGADGVRHNHPSYGGGYYTVGDGMVVDPHAVSEAWKFGYKPDDGQNISMRPGDLDPYRAHHQTLRSQDNVESLMNSMNERGFDNSSPIHLSIGRDGSMVVGEGNHRVVAANRAGLDAVPVQPYAFHLPRMGDDVSSAMFAPKRRTVVLTNMRDAPKTTGPSPRTRPDAEVEAALAEILGGSRGN